MRRKLAATLFVSAGALALLAIALWPRAVHLPLKPILKPRAPMPSFAEQRRENEQVIAKLRSDPKPESQDKVGRAQMRLAYLDAKDHHFEASRRELLQAAKVKGTGMMGADFGGINDQAAYQAAVCLVAEHKDNEARSAFRQFMVGYPISPLVYAAAKRLVRLNHGHAEPTDEVVLQRDIDAQEKRARFETSVCGPKTVAYMLENGLLSRTGQNTRPAALPVIAPAKMGRGRGGGRTGSPIGAAPDTQYVITTQSPDYKELAKLCHTTDKGTSIEGLRQGLRQLGISSIGLELNREDFQKLPLPAILLEGDHYFALLERHDDKLVVFDTLLNSKREETLPKLNDPTFRATVIAFQLGDLAEAPLVAGPPPHPGPINPIPPSQARQRPYPVTPQHPNTTTP